MKQIKTIHHRIDDAGTFDKQINTAITEGWQLTKREFIPGYCMLYAELEREEITEAERCCENCKHYEQSAATEPCRSCSENADKWEPAT